MYNTSDLIARYIPLIESIKLESRKWLMIAIISRFLFIPAFYFTAKFGDEGWMIMLISLLGLTNGYLTVCVMTVAPKGCTVSQYYTKCFFINLNFINPFVQFIHRLCLMHAHFLQGPEANALGNILVLFLLGGIFLGVALDWLWLIGNGSF